MKGQTLAVKSMTKPKEPKPPWSPRGSRIAYNWRVRMIVFLAAINKRASCDCVDNNKEAKVSFVLTWRKNGAEWPRMAQNGAKWSRMAQNGAEWR